MGLVILETPDALWPCHHIQIIDIISMRCRDRMIAARDEHDIGIVECHSFIDRPVIGIDSLKPEPLSGIDAMIIGFFQKRFVWQIILIVLVGWIA